MLAIIPSAASAAGLDFQLGVNAMYNNILQDPREVVANTVVWDDFSYGIDARLSLGILQISGLFLYEPGDSTGSIPHGIPMFLDVGVKFDIAMFSLGVGIGPNMYFSIGGNDVFDIGANLKLFADINLGRWTVSVSYYMMLNFDDWGDVSGTYTAAQQALALMEGYIGVSVLYKF